jgi:hypothetical protein
VPAMAGGAAGRVVPLHGEMTLSFLTRIAARYHQSARDLVAAVTEIDGMQNLTGSIHPDSEIHLNATARHRVSSLCHVPLLVLERALPAWSNEEPRGRYPAGPVGRLTRGEEAVAPWGPACPACTASRTGRPEPARRYLAPEQRVCARHRYWLLYLPGTGGLPIPLDRCPELIQSQRQHARLLRHSPVAAQAFEVARAVTGTWWDQPWPDEEQPWPARLQATRPTDTDPGWWQTVARDLITYPETVAVARVLASPRWQQHTVRQLREHRPYRLGEVPALLAELAHQLQRPWIIQRLAPVTHGPLFTWVHACALAHASTAPADQQARWKVHSPHRPRPLSDLLPTAPLPGSRPDRQPPRRLRGHSLRAEQAFATGLLHARTYHAEHGHLAVPTHAAPGGYPLGQWIVNRRTVHTQLPDHQAAALTAIDPWWNAPWSRQWQRIWHQARTHTATHGPLQPAKGFPTTSYNLGEWLYQQCTRYRTLHPEQQRLLAELGITPAAEAAAKPRRRSHEDRFQEGLAHARAYATEHGHLAHASASTVHHGYPLGRWLASQRARQHRTALTPARQQALAAIDPWWRPPWNLTWQRDYYRARDAAHGRLPQAANSFDDPADPRAADWLRRQCTAYAQLHPGQQHLLAALGITTKTAPRLARTLPASSGRTPLPAQDSRPKRPRQGHRPSQRPGWETALAHAQAWHTEHGHLCPPIKTVHDGFPLGEWLNRQRGLSKKRSRPSPTQQALTTMDPWWNPPWPIAWQRAYHHAHTDPRHPSARHWRQRQRRTWPLLHPDQQHLLTALDLAPPP